MNNHISVIVVTYNAERYIQKGFIENLVVNSQANCFKISFIILDNGSCDDTVELIKTRFPEIDLIISYSNTGYCKGVNIALQYAYQKYNSKYFIIFDQDAKSEKNYLQKLVAFMENHPEAGFVQPLIKSLSDHSKLYSAGHEYIGKNNLFCRPATKTKKKDGFIEILSGSILGSIVSQVSLKKNGLLDPRFELYYESSDWCFRFRKNGFKCYCLYDAVVYHARNLNKSNLQQLYFVFRNKILFWAKHNHTKFLSCKQEFEKEIKCIEKKQKNKPFVRDSFLQMKMNALKDGLALSKKFKGNYSEPNLKFYKFDCVVLDYRKKYLSGN